MRVVCLASAPVFIRPGREPIDAGAAEPPPLVLDASAPGAFDRALDAVLETPALVVLPRWAPDPARRLIALLRTAIDVPLVAVEVDLPPLGLVVLAERLQTAAYGRRSVDVLAAAAPYVAAEITSLAVVRSVSRMERAPTTLLQHVRSWLPHSRFVVRATGRPLVLRADDPAAAGLVAPDDDAVVVTAVAARGDTTWLDDQLAVVPPDRRLAAQSAPGSVAYWGTDQLVEVVLSPLASPVLDRSWRPVPCSTCRWCDGLVPGAHCLVCGMAVDDSAAAARSRPPAPSARSTA